MTVVLSLSSRNRPKKPKPAHRQPQPNQTVQGRKDQTPPTSLFLPMQLSNSIGPTKRDSRPAFRPWDAISASGAARPQSPDRAPKSKFPRSREAGTTEASSPPPLSREEHAREVPEARRTMRNSASPPVVSDIEGGRRGVNASGAVYSALLKSPASSET